MNIRAFLGLGLLLSVLVSFGCADFKFGAQPVTADYFMGTMECVGEAPSSYPPYCRPLP